MINERKSVEDINKAYDSPSWFYDLRGFFILTFAYRSTLFQQIRFFGKNIKGKHLEAAVGSGTLLYTILKWLKFKKINYDQIYGFDYAQAMLDGAIKRFKNDDNIILQSADAADLPYESHFFDTVSIANAVHCFPEVEKSLGEIVRVTKPDGSIFFNVLMYPKSNSGLDKIANKINDWGMKKGILITPYSEEDIDQLVKKLNVEMIAKNRSGNCLEVELKKL